QYWLQRTTVERVPRCACEPRDEVGRPPARNSGVHQLGNGLDQGALVGGALCPRAEHQHDLALRRLGEPFRDLCRRAADDLLEPLRELATDRDWAGRRSRRERTQRLRQSLWRLERDDGPSPPCKLLPER